MGRLLFMLVVLLMLTFICVSISRLLKRNGIAHKDNRKSNIVLAAIGIVMALGICVFAYEIKHAKEIDDKESFLWDDYDEKKDKTLK